MIKHAFLIIAHNQFEQLKILLKMLDDERNDIYIHIDSKAAEIDFDDIKKVVTYSRIFFTKRTSVTWGDFSQINAEMILLETAVNNQNNELYYSYFHLLSGVDLPIKSNEEIHKFFSDNNGKEFVHFSGESQPNAEASRIRYYHVFRKKRNLFYKVIAQIALRIQKLVGVNRLKNSSLIVKKGTNWFSITHNFANYLVSKRSEMENIFSYSYCADELFVQTLLINSDFKENLYMPDCNNDQLACARYIDWNRGNPYTFRIEDFNDIISSPAMFARKFSMETDKEIIYKIYDYVEGKSK